MLCHQQHKYITELIPAYGTATIKVDAQKNCCHIQFCLNKLFIRWAKVGRPIQTVVLKNSWNKFKLFTYM